MPKFAANLTMLFNEVPFLERFKLAHEAGFQYVEYLFPYDYKATTLRQKLEDHQLKQVLFNLPPGDWGAGERGIACLPDRVDEFKAGVENAIEYATALGVKQVNCLSGITPTNIDIETLTDTMTKNVAYAATKLALHDITLMIEPINSRVDMPGFFVDTLDKALALIKAVAQPNLKVQFDFYHMQIMHGDLIRRFKQHFDAIGHVQFADNPGRHEPGTGEINYPAIFATIDQLGYEGFVSAEYRPKLDTSSSLSWLDIAN